MAFTLGPKPLFIFDLDGTLSLCEHRQHYVSGEGKKDWDAFFEACDLDPPNLPVIATMTYLHDCGSEIWIYSGRSDKVRDKTIVWLYKHTFLSLEEIQQGLSMRRDGTFTPDEHLKAGWLNTMHQDNRARLVAAFDDRDKVVKMWRANGVACFQVAPGDF